MYSLGCVTHLGYRSKQWVKLTATFKCQPQFQNEDIKLGCVWLHRFKLLCLNWWMFGLSELIIVCLPLGKVKSFVNSRWCTLSYTLLCWCVTFGKMNDHSNIVIFTVAIYQHCRESTARCMGLLSFSFSLKKMWKTKQNKRIRYWKKWDEFSFNNMQIRYEQQMTGKKHISIHHSVNLMEKIRLTLLLYNQ